MKRTKIISSTPTRERVLCYENKTREKVYIGASTLTPHKGGGIWHGFSEPDGTARIAVRPFRYCPLPLLIPYHGKAAAWGIFARAKGGDPLEVIFSPDHEAHASAILGPDGAPAR